MCYFAPTAGGAAGVGWSRWCRGEPPGRLWSHRPLLAYSGGGFSRCSRIPRCRGFLLALQARFVLPGAMWAKACPAVSASILAVSVVAVANVAFPASLFEPSVWTQAGPAVAASILDSPVGAMAGPAFTPSSLGVALGTHAGPAVSALNLATAVGADGRPAALAALRLEPLVDAPSLPHCGCVWSLLWTPGTPRLG